jgi:RIO-like serine/threonine protein kinase
MDIDAMILRAMLRLARRREASDEEALALRVGATHADVRASIRRLDGVGLVERRGADAPRLTMAGLATAVALLPARAPRSVQRQARRASRAA